MLLCWSGRHDLRVQGLLPEGLLLAVLPASGARVVYPVYRVAVWVVQPLRPVALGFFVH
jgi:hypothetical protein